MKRPLAATATAFAVLAKKLTGKKAVLLSLAFLAAAALFRNQLKDLLSAAMLFLAGAFSTYYKRKLEGFGAVGFELVTSTTLIAGIAFGPLAGAVFGFVTSLTSVIISRDVGPTTTLFIAASAIIGATASTLSAFIGLVPLGMLAVLFSTLAIHAVTFLVISEQEIKIMAATGIIVNFFVNYLFLSFLAKPILALIA